MFGLGWLKRRKVPELSAELQSVLNTAERLARAFSQDYVGVEHAVLALRTLPPEHLVLRILEQLGVDLLAYFRRLEAESKVYQTFKVPERLPRTPRLNFILKLASRWSEQGQSAPITCLGFLRCVAYERESLPARLLTEMYLESTAEYSAVRQEAQLLLSYLLLRGEPLTLKNTGAAKPGSSEGGD